MKRITKTSSRSRAVKNSATTISAPLNIAEIQTKTRSASKGRSFLTLTLILLVLGGYLVAKKYKNLIIVGKVDGQYVTRWELEKTMNDRYAKTVFDDLSSTIFLNQLARKDNIVVSKEELQKEIDATQERLGGKEALQSTLDRLGYSQSRFEEEMSTQVMVRKLAEKELKIEVTSEEVDKFYESNKTLFPGKLLEAVREDIKKNLTEQKLQQQFTTWFQEQKTKAAITSYL